MRIGVYPGSFNPPTVAHVGVARAALLQRHLDRVDLVVSQRALDKEHVVRPLFEHRMLVLRSLAESIPWLGVKVTEAQLLADISVGYDVLVLGADKWHQVLDVRYYGGSSEARDEAVARLPELAIAPRSGLAVPADHALRVAADLGPVSSTHARGGRHELMVEVAARFDRVTGAWTDVDRYDAWLRSRRGERLDHLPGEEPAPPIGRLQR